ncbi:MAG: hypothetical protein R3Y63_14240 [Eubacteriales bacterium]
MTNHEMISEIYYHAVEEARDVTKRSANTITRLKSHEVVTELEKLLNPEEKILFEKLLDLWMSMEVASNEESFILGFRIGAKLMDEILEKDSSLS